MFLGGCFGRSLLTAAQIATSLPSFSTVGTYIDPLPVSAWTWSYKYLQRWLPGEAVVDVAATRSPYVSVLTVAGELPQPVFPTPQLPPDTTVPGFKSPGRSKRVLSESEHYDPPLDGCGVALLEDQPWTLEDKAARMEALQLRHDRHGCTQICPLQSYGDATATQCELSIDNDNWGVSGPHCVLCLPTKAARLPVGSTSLPSPLPQRYTAPRTSFPRHEPLVFAAGIAQHQ